MLRRVTSGSLCVLLMVVMAGAQGHERRERTKRVHAALSGYQEVPTLSTPARGEFQAIINPFDLDLMYRLEYGGLEGNITQAHIHLGARGTNGGIMIWLCGTTASPGPEGTPTCPQAGVVNRRVTADDVVGPGGQGISAGEFAEVLAALREGVAYANVHSSKYTGGEIRGQIRDRRD
jgi:hypothetical protein